MNTYEVLIENIKKLAGIYSSILNPGASDTDIDTFVKNIQVNVPASFIDFYKVCDGARSYTTVDIEGMGFMTLQGILQIKKSFDEILIAKQEENEFFYWHKDWLPFADDHSYDTLAIDTSGAATGRKGCVLKRSKDMLEDDPMSIVAPDFRSFINGWAKRVEEEKVYSFSEKDKEGNNKRVEDSYNYDHRDRVHFITR